MATFGERFVSWLDRATVALTGFHIDENGAIETGRRTFEQLRQNRMSFQEAIERLRDQQGKPHFGLVKEGFSFDDEREGFIMGGFFRGEDYREWDCNISLLGETFLTSYPRPLQDFTDYHRYNLQHPDQQPGGLYTSRIQQAFGTSPL